MRFYLNHTGVIHDITIEAKTYSQMLASDNDDHHDYDDDDDDDYDNGS